MAQRDLCELKNPEYLTPQYANIMAAGPEVVNFRKQSPSIYENILKLSLHLSDEEVVDYLKKYQTAFIERFTNSIVDLADSAEMSLGANSQFSQDLKRLSNLEREIFEQHRRSRHSFNRFKGRTSYHQVETNEDMIDEDVKKAYKR